ncbi:MAG: UDP-N-acetylglucosamine diphosphorylase/glucosamine-1-phosphate N-acetyltransferase [Methylobacterium sp.]|nr:UDP-N-acetylglucosamine diphosphorylase/glucosamine-1-phosphate N-acetyltransferase [Methylobacterium sp.]
MSSSTLNVVILAAGKGTRMHSHLPKVLHPVADKPLLAHVVDCARTLAPGRILVVHGHGAETVRATITGTDIHWVHQAEQLGTGHALQQAVPHLLTGGTALVLFGDVPLIRAETCRQLLHKAQKGLTLLTFITPQPKGYGRIIRGADGRVQRIVEEKDADEEQRAVREVNSGIMAMPVHLIADWLSALRNDNAQGEYYLTDIVALAVRHRVPVESVTTDAAWEVAGVNSKSDLAMVERQYQRLQAETLLSQGVTLRDPQRLDVRGALRVGRDVEIDVGCIFEGQVEIGAQVRIGPYCVLRNATIGDGVTVAAFSHIEDASIGADSRIGPYARLRPGSELMRDTHIGNFVEIKNSRIGQGSKVNHLSYIGDSDIGKDVNVGAGTITCNYDGANKHRTVIGDRAFIGSDSQLVAPVTVAAGATIGAGSTITRDAPADMLTLSRTRQVSIQGWKRPRKLKT